VVVAVVGVVVLLTGGPVVAELVAESEGLHLLSQVVPVVDRVLLAETVLLNRAKKPQTVLLRVVAVEFYRV
jgi:hypothetical protein